MWIEVFEKAEREVKKERWKKRDKAVGGNDCYVIDEHWKWNKNREAINFLLLLLNCSDSIVDL